MIEQLYICKSSMVTPLGVNTEMTNAILNAGVSAYETSCYFGRQRQALVMANVPDGAVRDLVGLLQKTTRLSSRQKRMVQLAAQTLSDVCKDIDSSYSIPVFIGVPEPSEHALIRADGLFLEALAVQSDIKFDKKNSCIFATGRAAGFHAIDYAFKMLASADCPFALVGGVDTFKDTMLLAKLDSDSRVLCHGVPDGFAPGEAASFILLSRESTDCLTRIYPPGLSSEDGHMFSDKPYRGEGLAFAFKYALQAFTGKNIQKVFSSMNGENYFAKEYGVAMTRNSDFFSPDCKLEHSADCLGDLGAAYGPTTLGLISKQKAGNYLAYASSDGHYRAAMCVQVMV